jgi:nucleoside-diphosphate-sugar epimerase
MTTPLTTAETSHATPANARTVLVLGANGRFGRAAVLAFAAAGWQVLAQLRRAPRAPLPAGVRVLLGDALDVATLARTAQGAQIVVNGLNPLYTEWAEKLPPQTAAVLALARALGATLMLPGNVYNFGNQLPALLTEATPFAATHPKAAQRMAVEAALADAAGLHGVRSIVIRAGDFLGDTGTWADLGLLKGLGDRLARGRPGHFVYPGPADLAHAWAWLPDLAATFERVAALQLAQPGRLAPHTVLHFEGHTLTGGQLQQAIEAALGQRLQRRAFPWWALRLASPFAPMLRALLQMRYLWQRPHQLDGHALAALLAAQGPLPHTPLPLLARALLAQLAPALVVPAAGAAGAAAATSAAPPGRVKTAAQPAN